MIRRFLLALSCTVLCAVGFAESKTEFGEINGAKFRIDVPEHWTGGLVMYCHGYNGDPVTYDASKKLSPILAVFTDAGYAVAQSGYATGGWAVQEAVVDTENLRRYFVTKYGPVKETYVTGHSLGGFITMMISETNPSVYDASLPLCGPLAPANYLLSRGAFDSRVVFDYYFPGALPDPTKVNDDYKDTKQERARIQELLDSAPEKSQVLRNYAGSGLKNNKDLASDLTFTTYMLKELHHRAGGNPFDNRNTIYNGTPDDNALNSGVKRYAAEPKAAAYVREYYTPTGHLSKPMLAVHTTYDPLVPVWIPNTYESIVEQAGSTQNFVQQFVKHDGHCTILAPEVSHAFSELREWKSSGVRPTPGEVPGTSVALK